MDNYLFLKESKELLELSKQLGFTGVKFLGTIKADTKRQLLKELAKERGLKIYKPKTEEMLRFALEKTNIDIIYGMEDINYKDSVHHVRGGLDQITCKIAASRGKMVAFSFSEILNSKDRGKLMGRIRLNFRLCKKYKVKMIFSNFSASEKEIRSKKDLDAFYRVLAKVFK
jgi:RNase P/RNase MRP subunit p30